MTDVLTPEQRRRNMAAIKGRDTGPEMVVRRIVHRMGYRYRLHDRKLLGRPDLVFASRRKAILVHGCFWHMHTCRYGRVRPSTHSIFWSAKRSANVERDTRVLEVLRQAGWRVLVVWECETTDRPKLQETLRDFLANI
jgi:DNA mismatch endonuclease, patch repair protein